MREIFFGSYCEVVYNWIQLIKINFKKFDIYLLLDMTTRNIEPPKYDGAVKLIKVPLDIIESIKKFSTTYEQR